MRVLVPLLFVGLLQGSLVLQLAGPGLPVSVGEPDSITVGGDALLRRSVGAGQRVLMRVRAAGVVDVAIYEAVGDRSEEERFRAGETPRTAKVFRSIVELAYPLASLSGTDFWVRIRSGGSRDATVSYEVGTQDEAMGRLRRGQNLERNSGTVQVLQGAYDMPLYQLVPGTVVELEVEEGQGLVAVLRLRDYLDVREGRADLASRCAPDRCVQVGGRGRLEVSVMDYDDRYVVAVGPVRFRYRVVATPEVLNYISSCT